MKLLLSFFTIIVLAFCSCTKAVITPPVSSGTITATVNGIDETFNVSDTAKYIFNNGIDRWLIVSGHNSTAANGDQIFILLDYQGPIKVGTYQDVLGGDVPMNIQMIYHTNNRIYVADIDTSPAVTFSVDSFSSTHVSGTFAGSPAWSDNSRVVIANGKYDLNFKTPVTITGQ